MWQKYYLVILILLFFSVAHSPLHAGSQKTSNQPILSTEEIAPFAKQVERYAAQKGARVFIIARLGSPKSELPEGIEFTHVGLAVYSDIKISETETIQGYAIHNLYQDPNELDISQLVMDYPVDFFMGAVELKAGILVPSPKLQQKLLQSLALGRNTKLHNSHYSIVSNPYSRTYQNCTEHILDLVFASIYGTDSVPQLKANQYAYFKAQTINVSPFKRMLAPMFSSDIKMGDQGDVIQVATFTSIAKFLKDYGLLTNNVVIDKNGIKAF
jgi:hypothetical protein